MCIRDSLYPVTPDAVTEAAICPGDSFTFLGEQYSSAGEFVIVGQDANGCNFNQVLQLEVYPQTPDNTTSADICSGESFEFFGQLFTDSGTFTVVRQDANGCNFNEILELFVTPKPSDNVINEEICSGETFVFDLSLIHI